MKKKGGIVARIHQGRCDTEKELLNLKANAERLNRLEVLDAVHQRMKKVIPKIYQRLVGPLHERKRDKEYQCYCNNHASLNKVYQDIMDKRVPLTCDDCWQDELCTTWGYYGWATKQIPLEVWDDLCEQRSYEKFVE